MGVYYYYEYNFDRLIERYKVHIVVKKFMLLIV
jgi:hypothetical protein